MKTRLAALLIGGALSSALGEEYTVYFQQGTNSAAMVRMLAPLRAAVPGAECRYVVLDDEAETMAAAINSANALKAGVSELPSLVISDERGAYASIPLPRLNAAALETAKAAATAPDRDQQARQRNFEAQQYLLFARMALISPLEGETLQQCLSTCRALMEHPFATQADKQRLGFHCLYPLLMREYTNMYTGAHTPASEAKLLEAIAALETARDLDRNSDIGKKAHTERERLRTARRQARTME
ncbi:MAG: hypothetical protein IJX33_03515 [Akkermansia sp.]|nr:hypothetical protein [Akkermansia sp.]